jgi:ribonuclease HI
MVVICDGGKRSGVAYGSYKIYTSSGELMEHKQIVWGEKTSNEAEYLTMLMAIRKSKQFLNEDESEINVLTDSSLVKEQVAGNWMCNYEHLRVLRDKIREELNDNITIAHVSRNIIFQHLGH